MPRSKLSEFEQQLVKAMRHKAFSKLSANNRTVSALLKEASLEQGAVLDVMNSVEALHKRGCVDYIDKDNRMYAIRYIGSRSSRRTRQQKGKEDSPFWKKQAHKLWTLLVKGQGYCEVCGHDKGKVQVHGHHVLPKERYQWLRYELINGVALCFQHHKADRFAAHRNPLWFSLWLEQTQPKKFLWAMEHMYDSPPETTMTAYQHYVRLLKEAKTRGIALPSEDQARLEELCTA